MVGYVHLGLYPGGYLFWILGDLLVAGMVALSETAGAIDSGGTTAMTSGEVIFIGMFVVMVVIFIAFLKYFAGTIRI